MKKVSIKLLLVLSFVLAVPQIGLAKGVTDDYFGEEPPSELGEFIYTEGQEEDIPMSILASSNKITVTSGPTKVNKKFVKYLTSSWTNTSKYSWSGSTTHSSTVTVNAGMTASQISKELGVSNSVTSNFSTNVSVPADSKKKSKLALHGDYNTRFVKVNSTNKSTRHYAPIKGAYLQVSYQ